MPKKIALATLLFLFSTLSYAVPMTPQSCSSITVSFNDFTAGDYPAGASDTGDIQAANGDVVNLNADIQFTFDDEYPCGQFVTGDWWVVGPINVIEMSPAFEAGRHGYRVNPVVNAQSLDSRIGSYVEPSALPLTIDPSVDGISSVLKAVSMNPTGACRLNIASFDRRSCLLSTAILTVLDQVPEEGSFRPPYIEGEKPMANTEALALDTLPSLPLEASTPPFDTVLQFWGGPYIDHLIEWPSRAIHPRANMRDVNPLDSIAYGARTGNVVNITAFRLMHDDLSLDQRLALAIPLTQWGIDLYHQWLSGQTWPANGGHLLGRKLPVMFAGKMLQSTPLGQSLLAMPAGDFQEDRHVYYNAKGEALFGLEQAGTFEAYLNGCGGKRDVRDPLGLRDGGGLELGLGSTALANYLADFGEGGRFVDENNPPVRTFTHESCNLVKAELPTLAQQRAAGQGFGGVYQNCCTSRQYVYTATAAQLLGLVDDWKHPAFFDYVTRWVSEPWNNMGGYGSGYGDAMYTAYFEASPTQPTRYDQNGDGMADVWWRNLSSGANWLYTMNGETIVDSKGMSNVPGAWQGIRADLNGDGKSDIVWRHQTNGELYGYLVDGTSWVEGRRLAVVDPVWQVVGIGDFNADNNADILWRNESTGTLWAYFMNGLTITESRFITNVADFGWKVVAVADVGGDGNADILWRHDISHQLWVYHMQGQTISQSAPLAQVAADWMVAGSGDFNGDGNADLLWRNTSTGQNWLYSLSQQGIVASQGINIVASQDWQVELIGDFDGDTKADIWWRNSSTGANAIYRMDGRQILSIHSMPSVDVAWELVQ